MSAEPGLPCVIDIEASGFGAGSYPIEIGWALADGQCGCVLVQPADGWTHWDDGAEAVHGIDRQLLQRHGHPPAEVALRLNMALAGQVVWCDAWGYDYPWLARLYDAAELSPRFRLEPVTRLLDDGQLAALPQAHEHAFQALQVQRHRASNDARALQRALAGLLQRGQGAVAT